ncbi:MAG: hypothetical protein WDO56_30380 [Gammaproteobacteria bacterium]
MPIDYGPDHFSLDRGIDSISRTNQLEVPLPNAASLPPPGQQNRPELDRLLRRPNLQDYLAEQMQPQIVDPQLLTPQRFELTLRAAGEQLRQASTRAKGQPAAAVLGKAARALGEEVNLRELLAMYRSTLFQG